MKSERHVDALFRVLNDNGFTPEFGTEPGVVFIATMPAAPEQKGGHHPKGHFKLDMRFWLRCVAPDVVDYNALSSGVTLEHDDVGRMLYYLGKAVGTKDAIYYLRELKLQLLTALHKREIIADKLPASLDMVIL